MNLSTYSFRRQPQQPVRFGRATSGWFCLLAFGLFLVMGQKSFGQTMTLSAPSSSGTAVDNMTTVFSISGETGSISNVRVVMTYTSGYSTESIGSTWTMTMFSISASQSFSFNPSTVLSSALFRSVTQTNAAGTAVTPATNMPDGVYSVFAQYTRGATATVVKSNTATNVTVDTGALPPVFYYRPTVTIDTTSDVITFSGHLLAADTPVMVTGTNLPPTTIYYVSIIDANTYKLTTEKSGSTFADFTSSTSSTVIYPEMKQDVRTLGTNIARFDYFLPESYAAGTAKVTFTGHKTVVLTLANGIRTGRISFDRSAIVAGGGIQASTSTTLPDDTYTVTLTYRDTTNHNSTAATLLYMFYDAGTLTPSFTSLVNEAAITDGSTIAYTLPEAPYGGTTKLTFSNATTTTVIPLTNAQSGAFTYQRALHAASIPSGTYTVTLSYQDTAENAVASTSVSGVTVTAPPLSNTADTDGDGLNDAAELLLASSGLDWQVSQPALASSFLNNAALYTKAQMDAGRTAGQNDVTSNPGNYNLYTSSQLQNLYLGTPVIVKDVATGKWKLTMALQKSTDLVNYAAFPFTPEGTSVNTSGQVEFLFTVPDKDAFFRVGAF